MIFDRVEDKSRGKKREGREKNKTELGIYRNRGWFFSKIDKISQEVSFHEEESRIVGDRCSRERDGQKLGSEIILQHFERISLGIWISFRNIIDRRKERKIKLVRSRIMKLQLIF